VQDAVKRETEQPAGRTPEGVDMSDIVDLSAMSVDENFPIHRAYIIFRALGLRHLTVVDKHNVPIGMISRKELIGMHIEHAVAHGDHHHVENPAVGL
jgi:predicted transcriptional regulator